MQHQRDAVFIIDRYDKYTDQLSKGIDLWMREMPLISVDMESRTSEGVPFTAQIIVHSFGVLIFRLDKLWCQGRCTLRSVKDLLPTHLVFHLRDVNTTVLVSGAAKSQHFGPIHMADIQYLFTLNRHQFFYSDLPVVMRLGGKSRVVNDYYHKPMKKDLAKDWFGFFLPHSDKLGWCGYDRWPVWRHKNRNLYCWCQYNKLSYWYMTNDVWVPFPSSSGFCRRTCAGGGTTMWERSQWTLPGAHTYSRGGDTPRIPWVCW